MNLDSALMTILNIKINNHYFRFSIDD